MTGRRFLDRAVRLVRNNRYLTLATCGDGRPWAAPINYVLGPGPYLHFYSARTALHSRHVVDTPEVACAIFDSTAVGEDVDGMQFTATCAEVTGASLPELTEHYFTTNFPPGEIRDWWYRPPSEFEGDAPWRFYRLDFTEVYLIDLDTFEETRIDSRVLVDVDTFRQALTT